MLFVGDKDQLQKEQDNLVFFGKKGVKICQMT